ncbi:MAG: hypothetical protein FJX74_15135 [Armatimonadetes bacterium]|nr:hypothetical protein [Armatimonadota bacterium]
MWQKLLRESSFFMVLLRYDRDLAAQARAGRCPHCGAAVHFARYLRKPRGAPTGVPPDYDLRDSFCCSREGCRKRLLPPSLRFFARRVYLGPVFVLVSAMVNGITEKRAMALRELVGVSRRTLERWRKWWRELFPRSEFWRAARGRFALAPAPSCLPASLVERFGEPGSGGCALAALKFLLPLSGGPRCPMEG